MALALMHIHNFHCQIVNGLKMLFLQLTIAFPSMLIIEKIYILVLGDSLADGLYHTTRTAEAKYSISITKSKKKSLSLHYSFLYANGVKVYKFKVQDSEIKPYPLCYAV